MGRHWRAHGIRDSVSGILGTRKRHNFTATGHAVGLAARIEGLTRQLDTPLLATQSFDGHCATKGVALTRTNRARF
jgi:class 3 adenylate cyclase